MAPVQLYVYDLSRGMAKQMSLMLTGKQIDGIWHTSVVVFGREIFFGRGILEAHPGTTHHGQPMQIIDCGETHIDQETFDEYIGSLGEEYTPEKYHLLEFNCNHFTGDVVGFLTGGDIPAWISGLPAEFLSTPFGQAMMPSIDAMFRRTAPSEHPVNAGRGIAGPSQPSLLTPPASGSATPTPSSILASVAAQATAAPSVGAGPTPAATPPKLPEVSPLTLVSSSSNFDSILRNNAAVIVNFTNTPGCPPCRVIKPVYESLAADLSPTYASKGVRFVEVELGIGEGQQIASRHGVSATPTFQFFRHGKKVDEMRGAAKRELENRVETFLEDCFPRHPHRKLYLPGVESIPLSPITSSTIPAYPALLSKLEGFALAAGLDSTKVGLVRSEVIPLLEGKAQIPEQQLGDLMTRWTAVTSDLLSTLKPEQTFPIIDLWRVGLLNTRISDILAMRLSPSAPTSTSVDSISPILNLAASTLATASTATPKPFLLTVLRLLTNLTAPLHLANLILASPPPSPVLANVQAKTITIVVESLLHPDGGVRSAAAGVAVNLAGWRHRNAKDTKQAPEDEDEKEWEVDVVSALLEGIGREEDEDVAHRLLVALALLVWLSPTYAASVQPLLEVLGAKETVEKKVKGWKKKDVRKLAEEFAGKLC